MGCGASVPAGSTSAPSAKSDVSKAVVSGAVKAGKAVATAVELAPVLLEKVPAAQEVVEEVVDKVASFIAEETSAFSNFLETSALGKVLQALPEIKDAITTVANIVIPPPGGQILGAILQIGECEAARLTNENMLLHFALQALTRPRLHCRGFDH